MNWREKRRAELRCLSSCDPALLAVRYQETALQSEAPRQPPSKVSLAAMIEAILDVEETLNHAASARVQLPRRCDIVGRLPSHEASVKH